MKNKQLLLFSFLAFLVFSLNVHPAEAYDPPVTEGLIAYWPFDGDLTDQIGIYNGTFYDAAGPAPANYVEGVFGQAIEFPGGGAGNFVHIPQDGLLPTGDMAVSVWIYARGWGGEDRGRIIAQHDSQRFLLDGYGASKDRLTYTHEQAGEIKTKAHSVEGSLMIDAEHPPEWKHVVVNRIANDQLIYFYINGVDVTDISDHDTGIVRSIDDFYIGSNPGINKGDPSIIPYSNTRVFDGYIDELMIFDRNLSEQEILELYNWTEPEPPKAEIVAHYKFNGNADDETGNHSGSVYGPTFVNDTERGQVASFDGIDDYITAGEAWLPTGDMAVSVWVYATTWGNQSLGRILASQDGQRFYLDGKGDTRLTFTSDAGGSKAHSAQNMVINEWKHLVANRIGNDIYFYIDAVESDGGDPYGGIPVTGGNVYIGSNPSHDKGFDGYIDELIIFDGSLTEQEILDIYNTKYIDSCQVLNQSNTIYKLDKSLSGGEVTEKCMNIIADNVTLDCQGHSIKNSNLEAPAIYSNADYVTIRNCDVTAASTYFWQLNNGKGKGISIRASYNLVENNIVTNTFWGIAVGGHNNVIQNNTVVLNAKGIHLGGDYHIVKDNFASYNNEHQGWGLGVWRGEHSQFINNTVSGNRWGVVLFGANHTFFRCGSASGSYYKDLYIYADRFYGTGEERSLNVTAIGITFPKKHIGSGSEFIEIPDGCDGAGSLVEVQHVSHHVAAGSETSYDFNENITTVDSVGITTSSKVNSLTVTVTKQEEKPADVTEPPSNKTYVYLDITASRSGGGSTYVQQATIDFTILRSWISTNNINKTTVKLYIYEGGSWSVLPTTIIGSDSNYYYYHAVTSHLSLLAPGGSVTGMAGAPGFEPSLIIIVITIILVFTIVWFGKNKIKRSKAI